MGAALMERDVQVTGADPFIAEYVKARWSPTNWGVTNAHLCERLGRPDLEPLIDELWRTDETFQTLNRDEFERRGPQYKAAFRQILAALASGDRSSVNKRQIDYLREMLFLMGETVTSTVGKGAGGAGKPLSLTTWEDAVARVVSERNVKLTLEPATPRRALVDATPRGGLDADTQRRVEPVEIRAIVDGASEHNATVEDGSVEDTEQDVGAGQGDS